MSRIDIDFREIPTTISAPDTIRRVSQLDSTIRREDVKRIEVDEQVQYRFPKIAIMIEILNVDDFLIITHDVVIAIMPW